jgi:hypothetical protein
MVIKKIQKVNECNEYKKYIHLDYKIGKSVKKEFRKRSRGTNLLEIQQYRINRLT